MGFFDDAITPPEPPEEEEYESPEWLGAPSGWVGGVVAVERVIGKSDKAAVFVTRLSAYPTGFSLVVEALVRSPLDLDGFQLHQPPGRVVDPVPDSVVRFGIEYADGRRASSLGGGSFGGSSRHMYAVDDSAPEPDPQRNLYLIERGGGGGETESDQDYWVWPLPPEGPVAFVCEWPALGIDETRTEIDAAVIREAADRAQEVWPVKRRRFKQPNDD